MNICLFETNPGYILDNLFSVFENLKTKQKKICQVIHISKVVFKNIWR